ncbi:hypothetical protein ACH3XW_3080 [Acanthocheilonema viteae]
MHNKRNFRSNSKETKNIPDELSTTVNKLMSKMLCLRKRQVNKPTQLEGGTISAFNDVLDHPEPDKVLDVQLLTLDTIVGGRCIIIDGLKEIFWRGKNNAAGISDDGEEICAGIVGVVELAAVDGKTKESIWKLDSHDFLESR